MAERRATKIAVLGAGIGVAVAALTFAAPAAAHISLENGGTHKSRYGDGELKDGPCGRANGTRGTNVYTYAPGQKITVKLIESIPHPSYFRFAFDNDGDDGFIEPATIMPIDPARKCPVPPPTNPSDKSVDHCGASDFYNSSAVLPNMDNLNPHLAGAFNTPWSFEVTLPNVECTNCTLQVIQVMEDDGAHGPYDPTPGVGTEDIYHQCIDIVLKAGDGGAGTTDAGRTDGGMSTTDAGRTDATPDSGRGGSAGTTGAGGAGTAGTTGTGGGAGSGNGGGVSTGGAGGGSGGTTGGSAGTTGSGGATAGSGGSAKGGAGGGTAGSGAGSGTAGSGTAGSTGGTTDDGCGCSVIGRHSRASSLAGWSVLALALVSRRRRR